MTIQSKHDNFNIGFCDLTKKFFIMSKSEDEARPQIGGFDFASTAIEFAQKRVS